MKWSVGGKTGKSVATGPTYATRKKSFMKSFLTYTKKAAQGAGRAARASARMAVDVGTDPRKRKVAGFLANAAYQAYQVKTGNVVPVARRLAGAVASAAGNVEMKSAQSVSMVSGIYEWAPGFESGTAGYSQDDVERIYGMVPYRYPLNQLDRNTTNSTREGNSVRFTRFTCDMKWEFSNSSSTEHSIFDDWNVALVCLKRNPSALNFTDNDYTQTLSPMPGEGPWEDGIQAMQLRSVILNESDGSDPHLIQHPLYKKFTRPSKEYGDGFYDAYGATNVGWSPWQVVASKKIRVYNPFYAKGSRVVGDDDLGTSGNDHSSVRAAVKNEKHVHWQVPLNLTCKWYSAVGDQMYNNCLYFVSWRSSTHMKTATPGTAQALAAAHAGAINNTNSNPQWAGFYPHQFGGTITAGVRNPAKMQWMYRLDFIDN